MVLQLPETAFVIGNRPSGRLSGGGLVNDFLKVKVLDSSDEFGAEIRILPPLTAPPIFLGPEVFAAKAAIAVWESHR